MTEHFMEWGGFKVIPDATLPRGVIEIRDTMSDESPVFKHYQIKSYPFMANGRPMVLLKLIRMDETDEEDEFKGHSFLLTLDQTDILLADVELSKIQAINEYIRERAMLRELGDDLDAWGNEGGSVEEPPADE